MSIHHYPTFQLGRLSGNIPRVGYEEDTLSSLIIWNSIGSTCVKTMSCFACFVRKRRWTHHTANSNRGLHWGTCSRSKRLGHSLICRWICRWIWPWICPWIWHWICPWIWPWICPWIWPWIWPLVLGYGWYSSVFACRNKTKSRFGSHCVL